MPHDSSGALGARPAPGHLQMVDLDELAATPSVEPPVLEGRMALFGDVRAKVTAVVGHAHASVGELLSLRDGTVLALDRAVDMPIDLCVEGRVVARGQLTVLGDQFAVRVTQVVAGAQQGGTP
jgi:flagellar motor switch protein FliN/FliY